ncbi:DUF2982 domain-containing protein [Aliiglaciecola sp. CAU 1673]|uniref:DUF2982 domain-containing protein n=1 Tax=Aliiglaciecola sp. CAU 1673 TaxID=3032595 RepID=UPI0023D9D083|nr:DUF2982 domain-containing protein [Aliiglaciecola sp. CAU 1673]MDF2178642.1 DUF2982 domain-containing protein [Aliiglaciecola sp. CAU 1673]
MDDIIYIRADTKRNGFTTMLIGIIGLSLSLAWLAWLPPVMKLAGIFLTSASLVAILIGWFKIREPAYSVALTKEKLRYEHRKGQWQLDWTNIQRVDIPRVSRGLEQQDLAMVGIRIKHYEPLLETISPRLASNILMQQRALLLQDSCKTGQCYSENLVEGETFKGENGRQYRGIQAMFANRMRRTREILGYDLFIDVAELDRPATDFVNLLRACQQQAVVSA